MKYTFCKDRNKETFISEKTMATLSIAAVNFSMRVSQILIFSLTHILKLFLQALLLVFAVSTTNENLGFAHASTDRASLMVLSSEMTLTIQNRFLRSLHVGTRRNHFFHGIAVRIISGIRMIVRHAYFSGVLKLVGTFSKVSELF